MSQMTGIIKYCFSPPWRRDQYGVLISGFFDKGRTPGGLTLGLLFSQLFLALGYVDKRFLVLTCIWIVVDEILKSL